MEVDEEACEAKKWRECRRLYCKLMCSEFGDTFQLQLLRFDADASFAPHYYT